MIIVLMDWLKFPETKLGTGKQVVEAGRKKEKTTHLTCCVLPELLGLFLATQLLLENIGYAGYPFCSLL